MYINIYIYIYIDCYIVPPFPRVQVGMPQSIMAKSRRSMRWHFQSGQFPGAKRSFKLAQFYVYPKGLILTQRMEP